MTDAPGGMTERLTRVETKLDVLLGTKESAHADLANRIADARAETSARFADHEGRIRALESVRWKAAGVTGVVAAVGAAIMSAVIARVFA